MGVWCLPDGPEGEGGGGRFVLVGGGSGLMEVPAAGDGGGMEDIGAEVLGMLEVEGGGMRVSLGACIEALGPFPTLALTTLLLPSAGRGLRGVVCGCGLGALPGTAGEAKLPDCVATELLRSVRAEEEEDGPPTPAPPDATSPSLCCFRNREAEPSLVVAVGVARVELGGLWEGCFREEISIVGEGRVGIGVSMVEGRGMAGGFARSSLLLPEPLGTGSVDQTSRVKPWPYMTLFHNQQLHNFT